MNNVKSRIGNFTSSEIVALTTNGKAKGTVGAPFNTYVAECNMERRLGRSISEDATARPLSWGKLGEKRVFGESNLMGIEYTVMGDETISHPTIKCWKGSPDAKKTETVGDVKCPMTLKSFCQLVDPLYNGLSGIDAMNAIRFGYIDKGGIWHDKHKDGEKFYFQLVSNSTILNVKYAELIVYCPYQSELQAIRELAANCDPSEAYKFYWIANANDEELPFLVDGGFYRNLNVIRFEVPQEDKDFLTQRVLLAEKSLIEFVSEPVDFE